MPWRMDRRRFLAGAALSCVLRSPAQSAGAPRIASADWAAAECLLALDIIPVAVAETALYRRWLPQLALPATVTDLGSRAEPNLELLAALAPERIFISNWQIGLTPLLERIAPVEKVAIIDGRGDALDNAREALVRIGATTGRQSQARVYLDAFDVALAGSAGRLASGITRPVYIGVLHENGTQLFLYGQGSWVHALMLRLGLRNALKRPTSAFGNALVDLAQLAESPDAILLYLDQGARTRRAERALAGSTLWRELPMVKQRRTRAIPPFYALGGLPSVLRTLHVIDAALGGEPGRRLDG
ncbi:ABC transporter substrate-binding protein [Ancylobacter sp. Lp-2]|uniref:ABC transporter substrate-binding protein n=1 Tax=Ancylobacter sp. Lp-2 TaxID=2881339 RepID=UPI001E5C5261|nr:ABC transporter substrate-binding protein [Ancylobacter sp. Lp-2]MCB4768622.1 ABC transporter substrate-binding protein [Ancylobacter sp. Lp-2]